MLKKVIFLLIVGLVVFLMIGCSSGEETNPMELVPEKANVVGLLDWGKIVSDDDLTGIYDRAPKDPSKPQTVNDALNDIEDETGINLRDFDKVVFFGDVSQSAGNATYLGVIVTGTFEKFDVMLFFGSRAVGESIIIDYEGYKIYTDNLQQSALAFLTDKAFVIGTVQSVKDVIDVTKGKGAALSGVVLNTYNELGDAFVKAALVVPSELIEEKLPKGTPGFPIDLSPLADIEKSGLVITKEAQSISLQVKLYFTKSDSAEAVGAMVTLLENIPGIIPIPEGEQGLVSTLLDKIEVETGGSLLTISIKMTLSEIEDLIQSSGQSEQLQ